MPPGSPNVIRDWEKMAVHRNKKRNVDPRIPHVKEVLRDGQWSGSPCVLIGGGPSLGPLIERLSEFPQGTKFAAANQAWKIDPIPSIAYFIDKQVFALAESEFLERWEESAPHQIRITNRPNASGGKWSKIYWIDRISASEWGDSFETGIVAANNTGLGLLNIVDILGADPIILLGYDVKSEGHRMSWHDDYPDQTGWKPKNPEQSYERWKICLQSVVGKIRSKVFNANPNSGYEAFEKITFDQAIGKCQEAVNAQKKVKQDATS